MALFPINQGCYRQSYRRFVGLAVFTNAFNQLSNTQTLHFAHEYAVIENVVLGAQYTRLLHPAQPFAAMDGFRRWPRSF